MYTSQVSDIVHSVKDVFSYPKRFKDYVLIVLLTLIGLIGTISCITGVHKAEQSYTIQKITSLK